MAEPFLGEIRLVSFGFPPKGWALCNGSLLPINQNQALFSLLGTTYGGDGRVNFGLPDLQGRTPIHMGNGHTQGERGGEQAHTLTLSEVPQHTHTAAGTPNTPSASAPAGNLWAVSSSNPYTNATPNTALAPQAIGAAGGSQAHLNMAPFLVLNYVIATSGIFPTQN